MTKVYGQIDSLKQVKSTLSDHGITRFSSIGEISTFLKNYESELQHIILETENELTQEIEALQNSKSLAEKRYNDMEAKERNILQRRLNELTKKRERLLANNESNFLELIRDSFHLYVSEFRILILEKSFNRKITKKTAYARQVLDKINKDLSKLTTNKKAIANKRSYSRIEQLKKTKRVVDELYPLIAGAVGENLVAKELEKLSDQYILINDYSISLKRPVYNKREGERIFGFQIDHLLVTHAGIFVIETKNWSKESLDRYDLRSPVEQVSRAGFALFVMLNADGGVTLKQHHWGDKEIPVKNIIAMINHKPREKFKNVKVKTLKELNGYISYSDPIFDDDEVEKIADFLLSKLQVSLYSGDV